MRWTDSPWFKSKWTAWICFTPIHGSRLKSHPYKIKKKRWSSWVGLRANNVDSIQYVQSVSTYGSIELFFFTEVVHPYLCRVILAGFSGSIYITEQLEYHYGFFAIAYGCDEHHQGILAEQHTSNLWRVQLQWSYRELQWNRALYCRHVYNHDFTSLYNCENVWTIPNIIQPTATQISWIAFCPWIFWRSCTRLYFTKASRK